jgi:hypothetical protein
MLANAIFYKRSRVTGRRMPFDQLKRREFITLGGRTSATCSPGARVRLPDRVSQWRIANTFARLASAFRVGPISAAGRPTTDGGLS